MKIYVQYILSLLCGSFGIQGITILPEAIIIRFIHLEVMITLKEVREIKHLYRTNFFLNNLKHVKVFCSQPRFKIMVALRHHPDGLTVSEIAEILEAPISRVSHQLAILRKRKFVKRRRNNRERIYTADTKNIAKAHEGLYLLTSGKMH